MASDEPVLSEQLAYYRARAPEYDEWFFRRGRYDRGEAANAAWFAELEEVRAALATLPLSRAEVLELAPGTGIWTEHLARRARHVVAIDAAEEMLELNEKRLGRLVGRVHYVVADLFSYEPTNHFDAVVCCYFLSHVPRRRLYGFVEMVAACLRPGGSVFLLEGRREPTSTAIDHVLPGADEELMTRRLDDGRSFCIVKHFYRPDELLDAFGSVGITLEVKETKTYFLFATGSLRPVRAGGKELEGPSSGARRGYESA